MLGRLVQHIEQSWSVQLQQQPYVNGDAAPIAPQQPASVNGDAAANAQQQPLDNGHGQDAVKAEEQDNTCQQGVKPDDAIAAAVTAA